MKQINWIALLMLAAVAVGLALAATVFEDDFDDNDISDWDAGWAAPPDSDVWLMNPGFYHPQVIDGQVAGSGPGYPGRGLINTAMAKAVNISAEQSLKFTARVKLTRNRTHEGDMQIVLFSQYSRDWDGYLFQWDSDSYTISPRIRIYRLEDRRGHLVGSMDYRPIIDYHTYVFERDSEGAWKLWIDGRLRPDSELFRPDKKYTKFTHVGVMTPADDILLDHIKIEGN